MTRSGRQSIKSGPGSVNVQILGDANLIVDNLPTELIDAEIGRELEKVRKARFFPDFKRNEEVLRFATQVESGRLSFGSAKLRALALAWSARLLAPSGQIAEAQKFLTSAKLLEVNTESQVAEAFIASEQGDLPQALSILSGISEAIARTAAVMIVDGAQGLEAALTWMTKAGVLFDELDSDGKFFLLSRYLTSFRWDAASASASAVKEADFGNTPALHSVVAMSHLLKAVDLEYRELVANQLPFEVRDFRLLAGSDEMQERDIAHAHFCSAAEICRVFGCARDAQVHDEYALWLELKDPSKFEGGLARLKKALSDQTPALNLVNFGIKFGLKLDLAAVERTIEREIALHGGATVDTAMARFALAFTRRTPHEIAEYLGQHHEELSAHIHRKSLEFLSVELFAKAGMLDRAYASLEKLTKDGISDEENDRLRRIIAEAEGADSIALRKDQFEKSGNLADLVSLVDELKEKMQWDDLCKFAMMLFERSQEVRDAALLTEALSKTRRSEALVKFLSENIEVRSQSYFLQMHYAWALYYEGRFRESEIELGKLEHDKDQPNYRGLLVNLYISTGQWSALSGYLASEYLKKENRTAEELLLTAKLALHVGDPNAKNLLKATAEKGHDDPQILSSSYFLASQAGFEDDPSCGQWLRKAIELSDEQGPLQQMTLQEILERRPGWEKYETGIYKALGRAEAPMIFAAKSLNKTLLEFMLLPAVANLSERDVRRRGAIPAQAGTLRRTVSFLQNSSIGLDPTAILTLGFLDLLDIVLESFSSIILPHSILRWLFAEKQQAVFHQPSRVKSAGVLTGMVARRMVQELTPAASADSDLAVLVGDTLAQLVAEAEDEESFGGRQKVVVRPYPVYRLSSLMQEKEDLSSHSSVFCSCSAVVEKLREKGVLTTSEADTALAYLLVHEEPWPDQPALNAGAVLFLDDIAVSYFMQLGILGKIASGGFDIIVSPNEIAEANALIAYGEISNIVLEKIEYIRNAIASHFNAGTITFGRQYRDDDEEALDVQLTAEFLALAQICDAAIADDRFINQHATVTHGNSQAEIYSCADFVGHLANLGIISQAQKSESFTALRRAQYFFMPVQADELTAYLRACKISDGSVVESAELKAVRENLLRARMLNWLQLPQEAPWLDATLKAFALTIRQIWRDDVDVVTASARSNWVVKQLDARAWAHRLDADIADYFLSSGWGEYYNLLMAPPMEISELRRDEYWIWLDERVLEPISQTAPALFRWVVEQQKELVRAVSESELGDEDD